MRFFSLPFLSTLFYFAVVVTNIINNNHIHLTLLSNSTMISICCFFIVHVYTKLVLPIRSELKAFMVRETNVNKYLPIELLCNSSFKTHADCCTIIIPHTNQRVSIDLDLFLFLLLLLWRLFALIWQKKKKIEGKSRKYSQFQQTKNTF